MVGLLCAGCSGSVPAFYSTFLQHLCKLSHTWLVQSHLARGFAEPRTSGVNAISKAGWHVCKCNLDRSRTEVSQAEQCQSQGSGKVSRSSFPRKGAGLGVMGRKVTQPQQYCCSLAFCIPSAVTSLSSHSVLNRRWQVYPKAREGLCLRTNFHFGLLQKNLANQTKPNPNTWDGETPLQNQQGLFLLQHLKNLPEKLTSLPLEFIF